MTKWSGNTEDDILRILLQKFSLDAPDVLQMRPQYYTARNYHQAYWNRNAQKDNLFNATVLLKYLVDYLCITIFKIYNRKLVIRVLSDHLR